MVTAYFSDRSQIAAVSGLWQWDYGQKLRIEGLDLPMAVEIHFSLQETGGMATTRIGTTSDGITSVTIPDFMLENDGITRNYEIYAFIYVTEPNTGETVKKIAMYVNTRPKPEAFETPEDQELFKEAIAAVNAAAERANEAQRQAEGWAHGRKDLSEREEDNAKYYAGRAADIAAEIPGAVEAGKKEIDQYVDGKEAELKGDTGDVYFAAFKVVNGRLMMYSDPEIDKVRFVPIGSRLFYRLAF